MRKFNRLLSAALAVMMLGSSFSGNVFAAGTDAGYGSTVIAAEEEPETGWTSETADVGEPKTEEITKTSQAPPTAADEKEQPEEETVQEPSSEEVPAEEEDVIEDTEQDHGPVEENADLKQPSETAIEDAAAEEPVLELSCDNADIRKAQKDAGEKQDPYVMVSVTGQDGSEGFPEEAYADVRLLRGEDLQDMTDLAKEAMPEYGITSLLPLEIGLYLSEDDVRDPINDYSYEPDTPVTTRIYLEDTDFIDGKYLLHYTDDGDWEQLDYVLYEGTDETLPYAEFVTDGFSPFIFADMAEIKEEKEAEPTEEAEPADEGQKVQPEKPEADSTKEEAPQETEDDADQEEQKKFASGEISFTGDDYKVIASFDETAEIPEGTTLAVRELTGEEYETHLKNVEDTFKDRTVSKADFFDISFFDAEGNEVVPRSEVDIQIQYRDGKKVNPKEEVNGVHFSKEGVETIDIEKDVAANDRLKKVDFSASSFSVYGVIYTVDFEYTDEETGKTYSYSIKGGSDIKLSALLVETGIANADKVGKYIDENVEDVRFSSPEYIQVSKSDKALGFIGHNDWILKSLKPFTSEETLTILLKDGGKISIKVTDDLTDNIKVTLTLIDVFLCETAPATGNILYVRPFAVSGDDKTYFEDIGTMEDNGDGTYSFYLPNETEGDGHFQIHSKGEKGAGFNTDYGVFNATDFSMGDAEDGAINVYHMISQNNSYGPIYPELVIYDALTGEVINSTENGHYAIVRKQAVQDSPTQWHIGDDPETFDFGTFKPRKYGSGHHYFVSLTNPNYSQPYAIGGTVGTTLHVRVDEVPKGYSKEYDKERSENEFRIEKSSYYQGLPGYYIPGSKYNWITKLYFYPQALLRTAICDKDSSEGVPFTNYALYKDEACTVPIKDTDGNPVEGQASVYGEDTYVAEHKAWFDYDWDTYGTTAYIKLSGVGAEYSESGEVVAEVTLKPHENYNFDNNPSERNAMEPVYLNKTAKDIPVTVTVLDTQKPMPGRTVNVYEFDAQVDDYKTEPYGTLTDNGDGTYGGITLTQTSANRGDFRIQDEETGNAVSISIVGANQENGVSAVIDISSYSDLLSIMKKDEADAYIGDISLIYNKRIIDSTSEEKTPVTVDSERTITVNLFGIAIDETKVEDNRIYTYQLPDELVPTLENMIPETVGSNWKYLAPKGNVRAYGRIIHSGGHYTFQIYFLHTEGQFNIEFGYRYDAKIEEKHKKNGTVTAEWFGKPLSFDVRVSETPEIWMEKKVRWERRYDPFNSSEDGSSSDGMYGFDNSTSVPKFTIIIHNDTGKNLTMSLEEVLPKGLILNDDVSYSYYRDIFKIYVDRGFGDGFEELPTTQYNSSRHWVFTRSYGPNAIGTIKTSPVGYYEYNSTGFKADINDVQCKQIKIAYFAKTYYCGDKDVDGTPRTYDRFRNGKRRDYPYHSTGSSNSQYTTVTKITDVSAMDVGDSYQKEAYATAYKTYGGISKQYFDGSYTKTRGYFSDSPDSTDTMYYQYSIKNASGEHWLAFEEFQDDNEKNKKYYFHAFDFVQNNSLMKNSLRIFVDGSSVNDSSMTSVDYMKHCDYISYLELKELCSDSGYDLEQYKNLPVYYGERYINSVTRKVWTVVSPETFDAATGSISEYSAAYYAPLVERPDNDHFPGGVKVYILGLDGNENIDFYYVKHQRTITPSAAAAEYSAQDGIFRKITSGNIQADYTLSTVAAYTRNYRIGDSFSMGERGTASMLQQSGELLQDGAIKWTLKVDMKKLKEYYSAYSNYYNSGASVGSNPNIYAYLFSYVPDGYSLNSHNSIKYDESFIPKVSGKYSPGVIYARNFSTNELTPSCYPGSFNKRDSAPYLQASPPILDKYAVTSDRSKHYYADIYLYNLARIPTDSQGCAELVYITQPDTSEPKLKDDHFLYGTSELVIPWGTSKFGGIFVDSAASAYVYMPYAKEKTIGQNEQDPETWTSSMKIDLCNERVHIVQYDHLSPYYFNGDFPLFDDMKGVTALDKNGKVIDIDEISQYIKLKSVDVNIKNMYSSETALHLDIKDENITKKGDDYTLSDKYNVPKFGFNRYSASKDGITLDVDYADRRSSTDYTNNQGRVRYGGDYYGMYGGFELFIRGIKNGKNADISYYVEFDHESFAKDYPEYGRVTLLMTNDAYRHYYGFSNDEYKVSSNKQEWAFAVMPDLKKECKEAERSSDYYTNTFRSEADIGCMDQTSVSLVDQISQVVLFDREGNKYFFKNDPKASGGRMLDLTLEQAVREWLPNFTVKDMKIKVKNRLNETDTTIAVLPTASLDETIPNGSRIFASALQEVNSEWTITDADTSGMADISIKGLEGAQKLNANMFAWTIKKADGGKIPAETYFEIEYKLVLDHERVDERTPFRHLGKGYPNDLALLLTNQMCILYNVEETVSGSLGSGTSSAGTAAAGADATARYLEFNYAYKNGETLENDGHKLLYRWDLISENWTTGTEEYLPHNWKDTMYVTAGLDFESVKDQADKAFGNDVLNAAWINLFYKHLRITGWNVKAAETLAQDQATSLTLTKETSDGKLVFTGSAGEKVTVVPDAIEKGEDGTWHIKKVSDDASQITEDTPDLYDLWETGKYYQSYRYMTDEEKAQTAGTPGKKGAERYGYGIVHLFDAEEEHIDHMKTITISYTAEIDWDGLFADAEKLFISDAMDDRVKNDPSLSEDYAAAVQAAVDKQHTLDELSEKLGLEGDDALKISLYDSPDYRYGIFNMAQVDKEVIWENSSWEYGVKAEGKMQKSAKVNDDGSIEWTIDLQNSEGTLTDFVIGDSMKADPSQKKDIVDNTKTALKHMDIIDFAVMDGENNVLYTCSGEDVKDHEFGSASGIYDNGSVAFEGIKDDQLMMHVSFDRIMSGQIIRIRYTTSLNETEFVKEGNLDTGIAIINSAVSTKWNTDASAEISNEDKGIETEKKAVETGKLSEAGWKIETTVDRQPALWLDIQDTLTVPDQVKEYVFVTKMKITKQEKGTESGTVIYDTENGIDLLEEEHLAFAEGFETGKNGIYDFNLLFNAEKTDGKISYKDSSISLPAGTKFVIEYVTSIDEKAWKEADEANKDIALTLSNMVSAERNGFNKVNADDKQDVAIHQETEKTGKNAGKDSNGNNLVKWTADIYLNEMCTAEELKEAETATITDTPESLTAMSLVEGSIKLYRLDTKGKAAEEIDSTDYTIDIKGKKIVITLKDPSRYPMVRVELTTSSPAGISGITNRIEASVAGKKSSSESEGVKIEATNGHYVKSMARTGELLIAKKDADHEETVLKNVPFVMYRLSCKEAHTHGPSCWEVMPCLIKEDHNDTYVYEYDSEYSEENGGSAYWETELITDENGQVNVIGLPYGTYRVIERSAPHGYINSNHGSIQDALSGEYNAERKDVYEFTINNDSFTVDNPQIVSFEYDCLNKKTKVTVDKKNSDGGLIAGARLQVKNSTGKVVHEWDTDGTSHLIEGILDPGTYTLHETKAPEGYETAEDLTFVLNADGSVTVNGKATEKVEMTDAYTLCSLKVKKTVAGNMGDRHKDFDFTLTLKDKDNAPYTKAVTITKDGETKSVTPDAKGKIAFKLAHGEEAVFGNIIYGTKYEVTEADYSADGYTTTAKNASGTVAKTNPDAVFTNSRGATIPTGIGYSFPWAAGIILFAGTAYIIIRKKRKT